MIKKLIAAFVIATAVFSVMVAAFPNAPTETQAAATGDDEIHIEPQVIAPAIRPTASGVLEQHTPPAGAACTLDYAFPGQQPGTWATLRATGITSENQLVAHEQGFTPKPADITIDLWGITPLPPGHQRYHEVQLYLEQNLAEHQYLKMYTVQQHSPTHISVIATLNGRFLNTDLVRLGLATPQGTHPDLPITQCLQEAHQAAQDGQHGQYQPFGPPKLPPPGGGQIG